MEYAAATKLSPTVRTQSEEISGGHDAVWLACICSCVSLIALIVYWRRGEILLYGDAVAHIGIARRVFDSLTPGLGQLGTVWLALPHLLMLPVVISLSWWRSGVAASIPSMAAYVFAAQGIFRLVHRMLHAQGFAPSLSRAAAWLAAGIFAANPNLLYLQATAMTEPLYLALFIWAVVYFSEFVQAMTVEGEDFRRPLLRSAWLLAAAEMTRYDGWFAAAVFSVVALAILATAARRTRDLTRGVIVFLLIAAAAPLFWLAYNVALYGNPVEFATGPYSARAIEQRTMTPGDPPHPGARDPDVAAKQYIRAVTLTLGEKHWGPTIFWAAVTGAFLFAGRAITRRAAGGAVWLLLWVPLPFYALSIAYGSVPIFLPLWWPYTYYNSRYGVQLLPAIAVSVVVLVTLIAQWAARESTQRAVFALAAIFIGCACLSCWIQNPPRTRGLLPGEPYRGPIVWREAVVNAETRVAFENKLTTALVALPASSRLLMSTTAHIGALQRAGIPLRFVVNEANRKPWPIALLAPAAAADYVIATDGDPVAAAVRSNPQGLRPVATIDSPGQPRAVIYRTSLSPSPVR